VSIALTIGCLKPFSNSFVRFQLHIHFPSILIGFASLLTPEVGFRRQAPLALTVCMLLHTTFGVGTEPTVCVSP
jgi:hypothetical protein